MRENRTYGSVRGSRHAFHGKFNEERSVETVYSTGKTMKHAVEEWRDKLVDEVTREEDIRIAKKHLEEGVDVNTIAKVTNLTVDEILQL
jgi:predicted transposase YdaD